MSSAAVPVAAVNGGLSSLLPALALGLALGLSLLVVALALTPSWALPRSVLMLVADRRGALTFGGFALALSIGLAVAFAVS